MKELQKDEKRRAKLMLRQVVMDIFAMPEEPMSEEEESDGEESPKKKNEPVEVEKKHVNGNAVNAVQKDVKPFSRTNPCYRFEVLKLYLQTDVWWQRFLCVLPCSPHDLRSLGSTQAQMR